MTMEEMWNMRASSTKSSAQPGPSATNQFNMDPGQFSQPYMAKEVCVIERTFRQDPMVPNMMNFNSQVLHPDKPRSELLAMVSGSQQHAARPSYASSMSGRLPYAASLSQFSQMNLPDAGGYSGWPLQSPSILSQANRGDGGAKSNTGADASLRQGRDLSSVMTGGRTTQDSFQIVNGSRAPAAELLTHSSLSFGRGTGDLGLEGSWHLPSAAQQWSTESARQQRQRNQSSSALFSTNSGDPCKGGVSAALNNTGSGFLSQSQSAPAPTSSGGLRVYCISYFGVPVVGQLALTDARRLGVTCTCHGHHMSVAKFTQHSGLNAANPGEVVYMEGGDTLVQWRKSFFSQYGVKVPEDSVGWEWLDVGTPVEAGRGNQQYKAAVSVTRSWQKELDVSSGGSTPMMKSRTTTQQMWDASLSNGNASTLHATESISNTKYGLSSSTGNNGGTLDSREAVLKSYRQSHKSMASDVGPGNQFYSAASTHENHYSRGGVNMGASSTFQSMSHSGHVAMSNGHNGAMNNGGGPWYNSFTGQQQQQQQVSGGCRQSGKGANHPAAAATRLSESGQERGMRESDISSSFELRLGQPSQQTQAAGTSFSSMATSSVEHPKSHLFEQIMSKVWDGKLQHNLQQFNPANLPKFSGIPGQARDREGGRQSVLGRSGVVESLENGVVESLENGVVERRGVERGSAAAYSTASNQSTRQLSQNAPPAGLRGAGVSELQEKLMSLESLHNQSDMVSRSGDGGFGREASGSERLAAKLFPHSSVGPCRSVPLENGTTLDSLSSGALVQLSKKTGQRLLETAIQSSFAYRAMGLEGPAAGGVQVNGVVASGSGGGGEMFGQLEAYGRSNCGGGQRARFAEFLMRNEVGQKEAEVGVGSADVSSFRVEQDANQRAFEVRERVGTLIQPQQSAQRVVVEECSERRAIVELGRGWGGEEKWERQSLMRDRNGSEQEGTVMGRQGRGWSLGGPEAKSMAEPGLESAKAQKEAVSPRRLSEGDGEGVGKEGEAMDVHSQSLAGLAGRDGRGLATDVVSAEEGVERAALSGGEIQCSCLKCRKASPLARGQAVPRLAGQVCLREKAGLASRVEAARTLEVPKGEHDGFEGPAQVGQPGAVAQVEIEGRKSTFMEVGIEEEGKEEEGGEFHNEGVPGNEDVLSDTAAKGTAAGAAIGRGSPRTGEATPDVGVCSNSSENISSGLSNGACVVSEKGRHGVMQGSGATGVPCVVDEGSGIGKCCSSDGVDMRGGRQTNALTSALEDRCKVEGSPSSLGCPSSSNVVGQRLVVKRGGMRGYTGGCHGRSEMEIDNEVEGNEPAAITGKLERKQRRNTKWKWLGSGGADGRGDKEDSPGTSSFEQEADPQVTSEAVRMRSKSVAEAATRPDGLKRDLVRAWSGEMVPSSKRRKLLVPRRHQEVKATNVTEENLEASARSLGNEQLKKKAGTTLVIRVPQGVNRQKAKKGIRTKLQQQPKLGTPRDWRADAGEEGHGGWGDDRSELEAGKSTASRATTGPLKKDPVGSGSGSGSGRAGGSGAIAVPNVVMKSIRSPRTPLAGPSPRNGRMVSLSVILNQPAAASPPVPRLVENLVAPVQKLTRDGGGNSITRREGTTPKWAEVHVGPVNGVTGGHVKEVKKNRGGPSDIGIVRKGTVGSRTRVVPKKEDAQSRKVRSMSELTGNDVDVHGPDASSVFEFAEEEGHVAAVPRATGKQQARASAAVQTDNPLTRPRAGPGRLGTKACPFPQGERSARPGIPNKRKVEWHRSKDAQAEAPEKGSSARPGAGAAEKVALGKGVTYVCKVSQVRSAAGSSISKEKLQQGFGGQAFPVRKQVRSSKAKRSNVAMQEGAKTKDGRVASEGMGVAENQKVRPLQGQGPGHVKGGTAGNGVLKRRLELLLPGVSAKRPRVVFGLRKVKEDVVGEIEGAMASAEQLKSSGQRGLCLEQKKTEALVEDRLAGSGKIQKKEKCQTSDVNGRSSTLRKERRGVGIQGNHLGQSEKCGCDVCGTFSSASYNKLLCCARCPVKVHQACYGVPKVPKGPWMCRICKFKVTNPICVLCGYGGGAMTRVQKARPLCQGLLQSWRELKNENACASVLEEDDDDETLLSATNSIQLWRARSGAGPTGMNAKKRECESCDCAEPRDEGSVCRVCGKESLEPGSSGGDGGKGSERGAVVASLGREDWRRSNTVGSIVKNAGAKQWAHMVCTLWMPGTRCLNMGTMGVFDVSGVTGSRRKAVCSMCERKGGACIQCRVPKCSTSFHVWCAHEKGLLQSETVQDGSNQVGFFGKCQRHADYCASELDDEMEGPNSGSREVCARTEGYKGRLTLEERAKAQRRMILEGSATVTHEQVAAWLRIDERKLSTRRLVKSANSSMKCDQREYLRFKQKKGWKKLGVYKSGIHALGLYTTDFIAEGEVVVEYVGEIVGLRVADKREAEYHSGKRLQYQGACYLFRIDTEQIIDATRKGGIARFVNHSCSPNCVAKVICVENLKKVVFFAKRDIYAKEEITYDYKFNCDEVGDKIPCFCGTPECRGTLN